LLFWV